MHTNWIFTLFKLCYHSFNLFEDYCRIIAYKFNIVINILELKKNYCVTQNNASEKYCMLVINDYDKVSSTILCIFFTYHVFLHVRLYSTKLF